MKRQQALRPTHTSYTRLTPNNTHTHTHTQDVPSRSRQYSRPLQGSDLFPIANTSNSRTVLVGFALQSVQ